MHADPIPAGDLAQGFAVADDMPVAAGAPCAVARGVVGDAEPLAGIEMVGVPNAVGLHEGVEADPIIGGDPGEGFSVTHRMGTAAATPG
jgi:hypothetical protein